MKFLLSLVLAIAAVALTLESSESVMARESRQLLLVEAGFVLKFPSFVTWPPESMLDERRFQICVLGDTDIEQPLREVAQHSLLFGGAPAVRRLYGLAGVDECHLLFISRSEAEQVSDIVAYVEDMPVLTVANTLDYVDAGVMINLFLDGDKVRFAINKGAIESSILSMSFRLLEAASEVR